MNKKYYTGIDLFRLISALLVVAIHTSPLSSISETSDFILTRVIARVAVPFFFMTSGFFLISKYNHSTKKLLAFMKNILSIYGIAIFLYIPINIYMGHFKLDYLFHNIIKDIVFNGTLYHLWYLPASVTGALIAWYAVKKLKYTKTFIIVLILYYIGLFGDSYYGIVKNISCINYFYDLIFKITNYTRNGIFFAPIFFVMGGFIADKRTLLSFKKCSFWFTVSLTFMSFEALVLKYFNTQRHDSMYIFLLPSLYFLFYVVLHFQGKRVSWARNFALIIYIIHPLIILILRWFVKITNTQNLLTKNSVVYYFSIVFFTATIAAIITALWNKRPNNTKNTKIDRSYIEINSDNLIHNVNELKKVMPSECELMAVVKARAYGHGALEISSILNKIGITAFAVATIDEGIQLRNNGINGTILILGYTDISRARELKKYKLTQTLIDFEYAEKLSKQGITVNAHIKIDTGMHRLGIDAENIAAIKSVFNLPNLKIRGIYTHLCCCDSKLENDVLFTNEQIKKFFQLIATLKNDGIKIPKTHIQSSYGLLNYPNIKCDYIRIGIALYGVLSNPNNDTVLKLDLHPVLSLKTKVILIRTVKKDESIGYGRSQITQRETKIAILPIGYADGLPRNLSNASYCVKIGNNIVPTIGRICMDQFAVDITDAKNIHVGDTAILIGNYEEISAPSISAKSNSISNELLCRLGSRLPVVVK